MKKNCVNTSSEEFKSLQASTGVNPFVLAAKIKVFQEENNTDNFPNPTELKFSGKDIGESLM